MSEEHGKRKLTLSVDEEVIEKAKDLGINISDVTEGILRGFAFRPSESDTDAVYKHYEELFKVMVPLLKQYGTGVDVGEIPPDPEEASKYPTPPIDLYLSEDGKVWMSEVEDYVKDIHDIKLWQLYEPKKILSNFVKSLSNAKERRKGQLEELEMATRVVLAMTESLKKPKVAKESKNDAREK